MGKSIEFVAIDSRMCYYLIGKYYGRLVVRGHQPWRELHLLRLHRPQRREKNYEEVMEMMAEKAEGN